MDVDQDLVTRPDSLDPGLDEKQARRQSCGADRGLRPRSVRPEMAWNGPPFRLDRASFLFLYFLKTFL